MRILLNKVIYKLNNIATSSKERIRDKRTDVTENLRKYDDLVAKNEERRKVEQAKVEIAGLNK